jgi:DNA polymerase delta subunit 1
MSPIKRALCEETDAFLNSRPKRLRGGGGDSNTNGRDEDEWGAPPPEELFDDDLQDEEQPIPEEMLQVSSAHNNNNIVTVNIDQQHQQRWKRPAVTDTSRQTERNVQWLDMDVVSGKPLDKNPNTAKKKVVGSQTGQVPVLRCFGVDDQGHSMALFIHGFTPYCYFALPQGYEFQQAHTDSGLAAIRDVLTARLQSAARGAAAQWAAVLGVTYVTDHKSIMGYETPHCKFLKIFVSLPALVPTLKRIMEEGIELPGIHAVDASAAANNMGMMPAYQGFETNVPFVLRFMVDRDIGGAGWLTLPGETYTIRQETSKETHCQVCFELLSIGWISPSNIQAMNSDTHNHCYIPILFYSSKSILPTMT